MPKRFSSTHGWLGFALDLARKKKCEKALQVLRKVGRHELNASDLRLAAQVNNRCGALGAAESCWMEIERRAEIEPGDYYMLGSLQVQMSKWDSAVRCFEREVALASSSGNDYFLGSSVIRLADLMLKLNNLPRAREVLAAVDDGAGDYLDGVGFRTKVELLREIDVAARRDQSPA